MITEMLVNTASVHIFNHLFVPFQKTYTCKPVKGTPTMDERACEAALSSIVGVPLAFH